MIAKKKTLFLVKRLWREDISRYKLYVLLGLFCMSVSAISTAFLAKMLQPLFDEVFIARNDLMLAQVAILVFCIFLVKGLSGFGESVSMIYVGQRIVADIQKRLFSHFIKADLSYFHAHSSGELVSRFTNDVHLMRSAVATALTGIGKDTLSLICLIILMFYQDWLLATFAFFVFPAAIFPIIRIGRRTRKVSNNTQEEMGAFNILLNQVFQGMRMVKTYAMEEYEQQRITNLIESLFKLHIKGGRTRAASHPIMEVLGGIAIVVVILYGGVQVIYENQTAGTFISFITALLLAYEPLKRLANLNANLQEGLAAAERLFNVLDLKPEIIDKPSLKPLQISGGEISFQNLSFSYPNSAKILNNISLDINTGQKIALVGPSGAGKSTILNLIPRFYDAQEGKILIDGVNISDISLRSLRSKIAMVSQEITLFDDTVEANIRYGRMDASDEDIREAAQAAAAHDFICDLPQQYKTLVGEQGIRLSGGQRQRLAIARAMLKNAPILLLDEATSALDTEAERQVQQALNRLMEGRTTIIVAHRLSTVIDADLIFVIEKGCITEAGTHKALLKNNKTYAKLVDMQFQSTSSNLNITK